MIALEPLTPAIGPAGDRLHLPFRITGGCIKGLGREKRIVAGDDFAVMYADEKLAHQGRFVAHDPAGDVLAWYTGLSLAPEGAYDDLLEGRLPAATSCRLSVVFVSTGALWRALTRRPLSGVGTFDGVAGCLDVTVLAVTEKGARN